jgi:hypothetical protein
MCLSDIWWLCLNQQFETFDTGQGRLLFWATADEKPGQKMTGEHLFPVAQFLRLTTDNRSKVDGLVIDHLHRPSSLRHGGWRGRAMNCLRRARKVIAIEDRPPPRASFETNMTVMISIAGALIIVGGFLMFWTFV